ncbi:MAG: peptidoglycan bridge formation glycyltransferase FemA/FemB family protein [Bdellovibrionaceae bacterium]|nr:peptidoglycan bridge formation glycyltransferase FemA/FemB family protein [Pseudobdellovibrionaceae bacterium]
MAATFGNSSLRFQNIFDSRDRLVATMPYFRRKNGLFRESGLFGTYGGWVFLVEDQDVVSFARELRYPIGTRIVSYRSGPDMEYGCLFSRERCTFVKRIDVDSSETLMESIHSKTRNQIRKAYKNGIRTELLNSQNLSDISAIYRELVNKHSIKKPYSELLLQNLLEVDDGSVEVRGAFRADKMISFGVFVVSPDQEFYWMGASNRDGTLYNGINAILWEQMSAAILAGRTEFNFGASPPGNTGLEHFKDRWGAEPRRYRVYLGALHRMAKWIKSHG